MSCESYLRANYQSFNVQKYLETLGLEDEKSAKLVFTKAVDNVAAACHEMGKRCTKIELQLERKNCKRRLGKFGTKFLKEQGKKLPKILRDMLNCLADQYPKCVYKLETIGMIHHSLSCRLLRMNVPAGYTTRIAWVPGSDLWLLILTSVDNFKEKASPVILLAW
ncbi:hypothetical protein DFQ28_000135 [Apophysomyces sp. BC1034]|nr:hypothetical protein DFQ30_000308 [Apophysomyces sp. BC1015]KAG0168367.1 hypothetical protein DFQ29_010179 [Apophysomyces sp. BC1021]KAG0184102.1 hypothetical protein DFQ28_000135 [Apophysomyces sp. BC1034]